MSIEQTTTPDLVPAACGCEPDTQVSTGSTCNPCMQRIVNEQVEQYIRAEALSGLLRGMARRQVRTRQIGDQLAESYDEHVDLLGAALERSGWTAGTSINALRKALDGDSAATPQPADDADRRALDSIAELCGARAGDHRDNVVMVVRSMLQDPATHNARRTRALAVTGRLVEVVADLIRDHEDPGTEAFGALWEGREFLSQGGGTSSPPPVDVPAGLRAAAKVLDEGDVYLGVTREANALRRLAASIEADPSDATSQAIVRALATPTTEETHDA